MANGGVVRVAYVGSFTDLDLGFAVDPDVPPEHAGWIGVVVAGSGEVDIAPAIRDLRAQGFHRVLAIVAGHDPAQVLAAGADDVLGLADARAAAPRIARWEAIEQLARMPVVQEHLVGVSPAWRALVRRVVELAHFTTASTLLTGESGTGKELVARLIHTLDRRETKRDLVIVDCTTIVPTLSGSELFGHERGAFTGAVDTRPGAFELAHEGTLFLDEIGELPLPLQAQLLRVIQERTYKRVGGNQWHRTELRLVCATHRDLAAQVERGEFRHDLYHRIATWTLRLPPLRERREDIPHLARHFIRQHASPEPPELDAAVARYLIERDYPGNVRELRHAVHRLLDRHPGGPITLGQVPEEDRPRASAMTWPDPEFEAAIRNALGRGIGLKALRKVAEDVAVDLALAIEDGSVARASRRLGVTDRAVQLRIAARDARPS